MKTAKLPNSPSPSTSINPPTPIMSPKPSRRSYLMKMQIGDSATFPESEAASVRASAYEVGAKSGKRFAQEKDAVAGTVTFRCMPACPENTPAPREPKHFGFEDLEVGEHLDVTCGDASRARTQAHRCGVKLGRVFDTHLTQRVRIIRAY